MNDPPPETVAPVTAVNEAGSSPVVLLCEHASNHIPVRYGRLGLGEHDLTRHIAYDIGAAAISRQLSALLDAPLFLSGYSRLLIDCNRPPGAPTSIPLRSEDTDIPGNQELTSAEVAAREQAYFRPFHGRVVRLLDARTAASVPSIVIGVHSFTPVFLGHRRAWHAGVLYGEATALGARMIAGLRADPALVVGDNEPYRIEQDSDYTVPVHGDARGIPAALIEVRQDLLADDASIATWVTRLGTVLRDVAHAS